MKPVLMKALLISYLNNGPQMVKAAIEELWALFKHQLEVTFSRLWT